MDPHRSCLVLAAACSVLACSSSSGARDARIADPPAGLVLPAGVTIGGVRLGDVYFADCPGWVFCDAGVWEYTTAYAAAFPGFYPTIDDVFGAPDLSCSAADGGAADAR